MGKHLLVATAQDGIKAPSAGELPLCPRAALRLNATSKINEEVLLGFGEMDCDLNLSPSGDLTEAAAHLFAYLHRLDNLNIARIAVAPIPENGLGQAINDRLIRAAAPRA